jgi:hypothetical protein
MVSTASTISFELKPGPTIWPTAAVSSAEPPRVTW